MGELSKVVRWSAPGSVAILLAVLFAATGRFVLHQHVWRVEGLYATSATRDFSGAVVAIAVAASVPLGYFLYQVYYYGYSRTHGIVFSFVHLDAAVRVREHLGVDIPGVEEIATWKVRRVSGMYLRFPTHRRIPWTGGLASLWLYASSRASDSPDRDATQSLGALEDVRVPLEGEIALSPASANGTTNGGPHEEDSAAVRDVLRKFARRRESNWMALESYLHEIIGRDSTRGERNFRDIERLADIYHTLGASKTAVIFAWLMGNVFTFAPLAYHGAHDGTGRLVVLSLFALAVSGLQATWVYLIFHENRRHCMHRRIAMITSTLADGMGIDQATLLRREGHASTPAAQTPDRARRRLRSALDRWR